MTARAAHPFPGLQRWSTDRRTMYETRDHGQGYDFADEVQIGLDAVLGALARWPSAPEASAQIVHRSDHRRDSSRSARPREQVRVGPVGIEPTTRGLKVSTRRQRIVTN